MIFNTCYIGGDRTCIQKINIDMSVKSIVKALVAYGCKSMFTQNAFTNAHLVAKHLLIFTTNGQNFKRGHKHLTVLVKKMFLCLCMIIWLHKIIKNYSSILSTRPMTLWL